MEGNPSQSHARNRRADECAAAICLIDGDQRAAIYRAITITPVHGHAWRASWRRCGRRRWADSLDIALPAAGRATRAVAEVLSKGRVVLLHSSCCASVAIGHRAVDHIKATLALIQPQLVVGRQSRVGKIDCT